MSATRSSFRRLVMGGFVAVLLVACGSTTSGVKTTKSNNGSSTSVEQTAVVTTTSAPEETSTTSPTTDAGPTTTETATTGEIPPPADGGIIDFGKNHEPKKYDNFLNQAFEDVTNFWKKNYSKAYAGSFNPVKGIYALYPDRTDLPESCRGPVPYEAVEQNAFYTDCGDIIVYDDDKLIPDLVQKLGQAAVAVVAAHEYGHAIQARAGVFDIPGIRTIDTEQQADCFAGAWTAHLARGESDILKFGDNEVKAGLVAMIEVRDPPGTDSENDQSGHGSAFDRVSAFEEGFKNGVLRCKDFPTNPSPRIDLQFTAADEVTNGNLPYEQLMDGDTSMALSLDTFWKPTLAAAGVPYTTPTVQAFEEGGTPPACDDIKPDALANTATYCQSTNEIVYDDTYLKKLYDNIGDLAFGYKIAAAWSEAVQVALKSPLQAKKRVLLNDCLTGAWLLDVLPSGNVDANGNEIANNPNQKILLSAGDLDEVVSTAVLEGDESSATNVNGTAFEKIDSFRTGVTGGLSGCQALISNG